MLKNRVDELLFNIVSIFNFSKNTDINKIVEILYGEEELDGYTNESKYDKQIRKKMKINIAELSYLKSLAIEKIMLKYYENENRDNSIIKLFEINISTNAALSFLDKEQLSKVLFYYYDSITNSKVRNSLTAVDSGYLLRKEYKYLENIYDIFEMYIDIEKENLDGKYDDEEYDDKEYDDEEYDDEFNEEDFNEQIDDIEEHFREKQQQIYLKFHKYVDNHFLTKKSRDEFLKEFLLICYASSKKNIVFCDYDSTDEFIVSLLDKLEDNKQNIVNIYNDFNIVSMMIVNLLEYFEIFGINSNIMYEVVDKNSMRLYKNIDSNLYKEIMEQRNFMVLNEYIVDIIDNCMKEEIKFLKDESISADMLYKKLYDEIMSKKIFNYSYTYCANEPKKTMLTSQLIKYLIAKFIEDIYLNKDNSSEREKEIYEKSLKLKSTQYYDFFEENAEVILKKYINFSNKEYKGRIYNSGLLDKLIDISPALLGEYYSVIDSKNYESIRIGKKLISILQDLKQESPFNLCYNFKKQAEYYEISESRLIGSMLTNVYENLLCESKPNQKLIDLIENTSLDDIVKQLLHDENLFYSIVNLYEQYNINGLETENELELRKNDKVISKTKVISRINPFYDDEKDSFK